MFNGSTILISAFWRAFLYLLTILLLLYMNIIADKQNLLLFNSIGVISQLLLVSIFAFLIIVLKKVGERRSIVISLIFFPIVILLAIANSLISRRSFIINAPTVILGILTMIVVINLFVQAFRIKKSQISIYYRIIATVLLIVLISKQVAPPLAAVYIFPNNVTKLEALLKMTALFNVFVHTVIPAAIFLMVRKLSKFQQTTNSLT